MFQYFNIMLERNIAKEIWNLPAFWIKQKRDKTPQNHQPTEYFPLNLAILTVSKTGNDSIFSVYVASCRKRQEFGLTEDTAPVTLSN